MIAMILQLTGLVTLTIGAAILSPAAGLIALGVSLFIIGTGMELR